MRALRRVLAAGSVLGLLALGAPAARAAPERTTAAACAGSSGVTVVVDFGSTAGGVQVRCAPGSPRNGFAALAGAGFSIRNVSTQPGFLCTIDGQPADDPCTRVPSAARYWSYWYAERGEPWTYSTSGGSRTPPPGSVEGWAFGAGDPPAVLPPGPSAPTATTTTTRPAPAPPSTAPAPTAVAPSGPAAGSTTTITPGAPSTTEADGSSPSTTGGDGSAAAPDGSDDDQAGPRRDGDQAGLASAPRSTGGGSAGGALLGGAAVVALVAAAATTARRRRGPAEATP